MIFRIKAIPDIIQQVYFIVFHRHGAGPAAVFRTG
jgi:hypothetical protein